MWQEYTGKKGSYTRNELGLLAHSLGFPASLLVSKFTNHFTAAADGEEDEGFSSKSTVSEKAIVRVLSFGVLFKSLEKVFNRYPASYNVKSLRKAMQHVRKRTLSFNDISESRIAFETHGEEDGSGLVADSQQVRLALKMSDRVISPSRLQLEIQRFSNVSDIPGRLQLYEFLDIVAICPKTEAEEERMLSESSLSGTSTSEDLRMSEVVDFDRILKTSDEKLSEFLDKEYKRSLTSKKRPPNEGTLTSTEPLKPAELMKDQIVHTDSRKSLSLVGSRQFRSVTPCLEESQFQLHSSRCGFYSLSSNEELFLAPTPRLQSHTPRPTSRKLPKPTPKILDATAGSSRKAKKSVVLPYVDPLLAHQKTPTMSGLQRPVRVRLQHNSNPATSTILTAPLHTTTATPTKPLSPLPHKPLENTTRVSEELEKEISDICSDSVINARETLYSSLAAIPKPCCPSLSKEQCISQVTANEARTLMSRSRTRDRQFRYQPIVSKEERADQQYLIDSLLWHSRRNKQHYQVIQ